MNSPRIDAGTETIGEVRVCQSTEIWSWTGWRLTA
jgi:hypothetical protein